MDWKDIGSKVASNAPLIGGILGGPIGAAVGIAGHLAASLLGVEPTPDAVNQALLNDPDAYVKLHQGDLDHQKDMVALAVQQNQMYLADVQNARAREIALGDNTPHRLAYGIIIGFFFIMTLMIFVPMDKETQQIMLVMIGILSSASLAVVAYYFGSSKDSQQVRQQLADTGMAAASAPVTVQVPQTQVHIMPAETDTTSSIYKGS